MITVLIIVTLIVSVVFLLIKLINDTKYRKLESEVLNELGFKDWDIITYYDDKVCVKSRQTLEKYDDVRYFREHVGYLEIVKKALKIKKEVSDILNKFLDVNNYKDRSQYHRLVAQINDVLQNADEYRVFVEYTSPTGRVTVRKCLSITLSVVKKFEKNPSLLLTQTEYNKLLKEQEKEALNQKHEYYYDLVNSLIDYANEKKDTLISKESIERLDIAVEKLFDRTVNSIKKIKSVDSEEWELIGNFISQIDIEVKTLVSNNQKILDYYESHDFLKVKESCEVLMSTQRDFNEYIAEKVETISNLFGARIVRNETVNRDEYHYIRPYKKTLTPFAAEVSAAVFASAENNPINYVIKYFYPDRALYPEQIQKLHLLIDELETLKEARQIIENHKKEYQQYLGDVPSFVMECDEAGFYTRLGFAHVDEDVLVIEYLFSYTSNGGMAKRSFAVPMTESNIVALIKALEGKLTLSTFTKEQRALMTGKLREFIKSRDGYACRNCGNSIYLEPNLLLEIDHIVPVSKGGCTVEENLQTLCWKCNRAKSNKLVG